jgi:hypothetical protein
MKFSRIPELKVNKTVDSLALDYACASRRRAGALRNHQGRLGRPIASCSGIDQPI